MALKKKIENLWTPGLATWWSVADAGVGSRRPGINPSSFTSELEGPQETPSFLWALGFSVVKSGDETGCSLIFFV